MTKRKQYSILHISTGNIVGISFTKRIELTNEQIRAYISNDRQGNSIFGFYLPDINKQAPSTIPVALPNKRVLQSLINCELFRQELGMDLQEISCVENLTFEFIPSKAEFEVVRIF